MGKYTQKNASKPCLAGEGAAEQDTEFQSQFPAVFEFMTESVDEKGKPRQTATVSLSVDQGRPKAALNDRQEGRSCYAAGETVLGALRALEAQLQEGDADWRYWSGKGSTRNPKK